eukprot:jgi/Chrzof1/11666/Cz06g04110.t1
MSSVKLVITSCPADIKLDEVYSFLAGGLDGWDDIILEPAGGRTDISLLYRTRQDAQCALNFLLSLPLPWEHGSIECREQGVVGLKRLATPPQDGLMRNKVPRPDLAARAAPLAAMDSYSHNDEFLTGALQPPLPASAFMPLSAAHAVLQASEYQQQQPPLPPQLPPLQQQQHQHQHQQSLGLSLRQPAPLMLPQTQQAGILHVSTPIPSTPDNSHTQAMMRYPSYQEHQTTGMQQQRQQPEHGYMHQQQQQPEQGYMHHQQQQQPEQGYMHHQQQQQPEQGYMHHQQQQQPEQGYMHHQQQQQPEQGYMHHQQQHHQQEQPLQVYEQEQPPSYQQLLQPSGPQQAPQYDTLYQYTAPNQQPSVYQPASAPKQQQTTHTSYQRVEADASNPSTNYLSVPMQQTQQPTSSGQFDLEQARQHAMQLIAEARTPEDFDGLLQHFKLLSAPAQASQAPDLQAHVTSSHTMSGDAALPSLQLTAPRQSAPMPSAMAPDQPPLPPAAAAAAIVPQAQAPQAAAASLPPAVSAPAQAPQPTTGQALPPQYVIAIAPGPQLQSQPANQPRVLLQQPQQPQYIAVAVPPSALAVCAPPAYQPPQALAVASQPFNLGGTPLFAVAAQQKQQHQPQQQHAVQQPAAGTVVVLPVAPQQHLQSAELRSQAAVQALAHPAFLQSGGGANVSSSVIAPIQSLQHKSHTPSLQNITDSTPSASRLDAIHSQYSSHNSIDGAPAQRPGHVVRGGVPRDTLYVNGFPRGTSKAVLALLFRDFEGYKGIRMYTQASLYGPSGLEHTYAFVHFDSVCHATAALNARSNYCWDLHNKDGSILIVRYAEHNSSCSSTRQ